MSQRIKMFEREPNIRNNDFKEVNLGYTDKQALLEAKRCLHCKNPMCVTGCPVEVNIPEFIHCLANNNQAGAIKIIKEKSNLPAVCGRVCPQEKQCESKCILGIKQEPIAIGNLERYTADWALKNIKEEKYNIKSNGKKVAIVGSGPAGLTCAGDLAILGYDVTIFVSVDLIRS